MLTRGIIYSFINAEANYSMQAAKYHSHSPPMGDDMAKFYRAPFGVHLTRDFIRKTTKQVEACCKEYSRGKYSEYSMIEL